MNFEEIKTVLEKFSGPTGRPMIVNRGSQGSPSSSIELLADDLLTTSPFGCTGTPPHCRSPALWRRVMLRDTDAVALELFGFISEGLVFEVIEGGWVSQVTCFKA